MELAFLSNIYWQRSVFIIIFQVSLPWCRTFCRIPYSKISAVLGEHSTPWVQQSQEQLIPRLNASGRVFSSFATLKACSVLQNEFSLCPCGIPAAQWGMWQVSREQLVGSSGSNCPLEGGFDLQGFSLLPQCFISVRESPSYSGLGLLIKTQALAEAKQLAVSSCSGVCIRHCLTGSISGEEIYILSSVFATEHLWLRRQMTHLIIVKCPREKPGGARHILTLTSSSPL